LILVSWEFGEGVLWMVFRFSRKMVLARTLGASTLMSVSVGKEVVRMVTILTPPSFFL